MGTGEMLGVTLRWTSIPSRGEFLNAKETRDKHRRVGSIAQKALTSYQDTKKIQAAHIQYPDSLHFMQGAPG